MEKPPMIQPAMLTTSKAANDIQQCFRTVEGEVVGCLRCQATPDAQQASDFIFELHEPDVVVPSFDSDARTDLPATAGTCEKQFSEGLIGHDNRVVIAGCAEKRLPFTVDDAYDPVLEVSDLDFFANRVLVVGKEGSCHFVSEDGDVASSLDFIRSKEPALDDFHVEYLIVTQGTAGQSDIAYAVVTPLNDDVTPTGKNGNSALVFQIGGKEPVVAIRSIRSGQEIPPPVLFLTRFRQERPLLHVNDAGTQKIETVLDVLFQGVNKGENGNDEENSDGDAQQGENGAQQVGPKRIPGKAKTFKNLEGGLHRSSGPNNALYGSATGALNYG
jgi:hypothetical protein